MLNEFEEIIVCILLLIISVYLEYTPIIKKTLVNDFTNSNFTIGILIMIIFSYYLLSKKYEPEKREKILEGYKKSLLALVIAYMAHLDLIFLPFWLVFILAFFFHDWV
jgi:hypothetical protein